MISLVLMLAVSALHVFILAVEMFLWDRPLGLRVFRLEPDFARSTRVMAANQGLYNGFLAAGLATSALAGIPSGQWFFLGCIAVAGLYGAWSSSPKILLVQTVPAVVAVACLALRV